VVLHSYWRSGAAYRTRIALNLKGLEYEQHDVDLRKRAHKTADYLAINPQGMVPALEVEGAILTQSVAILEWLEEAYPESALLPSAPLDRARVRAMAALIGSDIHPLNNLRVLGAVRGLGADQDGIDAWARGWIAAGFDALEQMVAKDGDGWSFGAAPTLADCYLIPQLYSARRFNVDLTPWPRLLAVEQIAETHPAFIAAHPDKQPDAD
jgi:maleylpyruvate isomerase